ncbi:MAG: M4 family metallopeptidase, partial [Ferruginibacter sp.]
SGEIENQLRNFSDWNGEHAARYFLQSILEDQGNEQLVAITSPESPLLIPNLKVKENRSEPLIGTQMVSFEQTSNSIPIFGSAATVDLKSDNNMLMSIDATLASTPDVSTKPKLSWQEALKFLTDACHVPFNEGTVRTVPDLEYYQEEETGNWYLAYHFRKLPINPPEEPFVSPPGLDLTNFEGCTNAHSLREDTNEYDFLVDSNSGGLLFWYSSSPRIDIPVPCSGIDEIGQNRSFYGHNVGTDFQLHDPQRNISTYDLNFQVQNVSAVPPQPINNPQANFQAVNTAAISAHYFATVVFDFYNNLLKRQGIDGKGMLLKSVVNVAENSVTKVWPNAQWYKAHMWYGQKSNGNGGFISFAQHLDVIGHELTHGVTETTSNLIYADLSGALNESFSDIFGIMIKNWSPSTGFIPIANWGWQIGPGLGRTGGAIRDFKDPTNAGQPDHFNQYVVLPRQVDSGGVHRYSGIHNKAVALVLNGGNQTNPPIISLEEVAILYYLTLLRLSARANFSDCRRTLLNVANTYYSYDSQTQQKAAKLITDSYDAVGIL